MMRWWVDRGVDGWEFDDIESVSYYRESVDMGEDPEEVLASLRAMWECRVYRRPVRSHAV